MTSQEFLLTAIIVLAFFLGVFSLIAFLNKHF